MSKVSPKMEQKLKAAGLTDFSLSEILRQLDHVGHFDGGAKAVFHAGRPYVPGESKGVSYYRGLAEDGNYWGEYADTWEDAAAKVLLYLMGYREEG